MEKTLTRTALALLLLPAIAAQSQPFHLSNGDRVVFYGDSITDQRLYGTYIETYVLTRFPKLSVSFVHSGWGGDTVKGGSGGPIDVRLDRDVAAHQPTVVTVNLGMNDAGRAPFDAARLAAFTAGYEHILDRLKLRLPDARLTLIEPSAYDDVTRTPSFSGGYDAVLQRYRASVRALGQKRQLVSVDVSTPVEESLRKANQADPELAREIMPDRVHPSEAGHLLIAAAILEAWGAPAVVTRVAIDSASRSIARSENTSIKGLECGADLSWDQLDGSLPFPVAWDDGNRLMHMTLRNSDFMERLNVEALQITGLRAGRYVLAIDGIVTGIFMNGQLNEGINLANFSTPMMKQAKDALYLTLKRAGVYHFRWRFLQMSLADDQLAEQPAAIRAIERLEENFDVKQRAAVQPVLHHYVLKPLF